MGGLVLQLIVWTIVFYYVSLTDNHLKYISKSDIVKNVLNVTFKMFLTHPGLHHAPMPYYLYVDSDITVFFILFDTVTPAYVVVI